MGEQLDNAIRKRKLRVVLGGGLGNLGLSYDGMELLPELFRSGRWLRLWREASALVAVAADALARRLGQHVRSMVSAGSLGLGQ